MTHDSYTEFEKLGMRLSDMIAADEELSSQAVQYARNKCQRYGIDIDPEKLDENDIYWTFVQEYTTNAIIQALSYNRTHIKGQNDV